MTPDRFETGGLIRLHQILWYGIFVFFLVVCLLYPFNPDLAARISFWGVIAIVIGTVARILVLSEIFRRARRFGLWSLCGVLLLVLVGTIFLKYLY